MRVSREWRLGARGSTSAPSSARKSVARAASRAAVFAVRAALVTASAACTADKDDDGPGKRGADAARTSDAQVAGDAAAGVDARVAGDADGQVSSARDASEKLDAAEDAGTLADSALDAEPDGDWVPVPIYGGVFPDPRTRARV